MITECPCCEAARAEIDRLREKLATVRTLAAQRLAEVEAERDLLRQAHERAEVHLGETQDRLEAVEALCEQQPKETPCTCDPAYTERGLMAPDCAWCQDIEMFVHDLLAAARGEGAQPAEVAMHAFEPQPENPEWCLVGFPEACCGLFEDAPIHSGEGDQPATDAINESKPHGEGDRG